ncbi:segregation/condensation protein A [Candidatus Woesearchaeota archaeon]|nr:segregation/condensation protein A [Candidatus Woesearchaeota archaeon]
MQDRIFSLLVEENEISWKSIIFDLIRSHEMDPWDVDVSLLSNKYIEHLNKLQQQDLKVSGKVLLAAAILLRIKSNKLLEDDLSEFDRLISSDVGEDEFYDELERDLAKGEQMALAEDFELNPRLPQARRRKVSVYDLVKALEKALEVKQRRIFDYAPPSVQMPVKKFDVTAAISSLLSRMKNLVLRGPLTFRKLLKSDSKEDKVFTFIPLLHLSNQGKIDLDQKENFGEIEIRLLEEV